MDYGEREGPPLRLIKTDEPERGRRGARRRALEPGPSSQAPAPRQPAGRVWAASIYPHLRRQVKSETEALDALYDLLSTRRDRVPAYAPPADLDLLRRWADQDRWEDSYQRATAVQALASEHLQADKRLRDLIGLVNQARDVLERTYATAMDEEASSADLQKWQVANKVYADAVDRMLAEQGRLQRMALEQRRDAQWQERFVALYQALLREYKAEAERPQYRVLARRLAAAEIRLEQAEESGRDLESSEFRELSNLVRDMAAQIQKHTEATKSESIRTEVQDAVRAALKIVERHLSGQPTLWKAVVDDVARAASVEGAA